MHDLISSARAAIKSGHWAEAERLARSLLARDAASVDALEILILAASNRADPAQAEALLRKAISLAPERRWPYGDLARLLLERGRPAEAEAVTRAAVAADPANADALMLLGMLELDRGLTVDAEGHLRAAIGQVGRHPALLNGLGRAFVMQSRLDEARAVLGEVVKADPNALEALSTLARIEEQSGRYAEAESWLARAQDVARRQGTDMLLQRSQLLARMSRSEEALALLDAQQALSGPALLQRGRLRDQAGRHDEAWRDWLQGKAQIARQTARRYDAAQIEREAGALSAFTAHRCNDLVSARSKGEVAQPVFILGLPRSGTTLVEQIVAAHDAVAAGGELPFGAELRELAAVQLGGEARFLDWLGGELQADAAGLPEILRDHYLARASFYRLTGSGNRLFTDKMPLNDLWLPLIRLAFPEARIVRVVRHPLDVLVSTLSHDMTHGQNFAYRVEDIVSHMQRIHGLLADYEKAGLKADHVLRYEALVANQAGETAALMAALGLEVQERQLAFHREKRIAPTPSYAQVQEPLNDRSIGRWRHFAPQLGPAIAALGGMIADMGYSAEA